MRGMDFKLFASTSFQNQFLVPLWTLGCARFQDFSFNPYNKSKGARLFQPCTHIGDNVRVLHGGVEITRLLHGLKTKSRKRAHPCFILHAQWRRNTLMN